MKIIECDPSVKKLVDANGGYCPCKPMKTPDTLCICKEFREGECGLCQCGRFIKVER